MPKKKLPPKKKKSYRSGFERKIASYLLDKKVNFKYEEEKLKYLVPQSTHTYNPDFELPNGIFVEAKGLFNREARTKMALVIEQHPDKDIRLLFMRDNYISKASNTKYSDWCKKRNIKYHVSVMGHVPEEWLDE